MNQKITAAQLIPENIFLYHKDINQAIFQVEIDPIDFCNHNCYWCFTKKFRKDKKIKINNLKYYIDQFIIKGGKSIVFSGGGEPLLYKEIYNNSQSFDNKSIAKYLIDRNIWLGVITNGVLIDRLFSSDFDIKKLSFIRISLDADDAIKHSARHRIIEKDFSRIINNISSIITLRGNSYTPAIGISFVVDSIKEMNVSRNEISKINTLAKDLKVDFVQFKHIQTKLEEKANNSMKIVHAHCLELSWGEVEFWVQEYKSSNYNHACLIAQYIQSIGSNNKKFPCCHLFGRTEFLDQETFTPIGKIIYNCDSNTCRYNELNDLLYKIKLGDIDNHIAILNDSLKTYGFHPYRLCPTAPNIIKPFHS